MNDIKITLIAAVGKNLELGKDNTLIWNIPEDMKFFRENTVGKCIVMGMNTFRSLSRLLPNRKHIVLTRKNINLGDDVVVFHNIEDIIKYIYNIGGEVMIIGGGQIYSMFLEYADKLLLTEIDDECVADVYFPLFVENEWDRQVISKHQYNNINYSHVAYTRKKVKNNLNR